jgi:hypothetical protein
MTQLQAVGIHNVQATLKQLDEILAAHATSLPVSHPSARPTE